MAESDFSEKLNHLLADPDALRQIMSIADNMMQKSDSSTAKPPPVISEASDAPYQTQLPEAGRDDFSRSDAQPAFSFSRPDSVGSATVSNPMKAFQNSKHSKRYELLCAIKPCLSNRRAEKFDKMLNLIKIAELFGGRF